MEPFLKLVAEDLKAKHADLSDFTVVFPNNRARLFFNNYLLGESDQPIWSPFYTTIQELFRSCTHLQVADDIKLICDLFKVYSEEMNWEELGTAPETLDDFYFWGEVLLKDFEDVDNNMVDAEQLFRNITELADIEGDISAILSEKQKEALQQFFANFSEKNDSIIKKKFAALWNAMGPIYHKYRQQLQSEGVAYGGMLHRHVVEHLDMGRFSSKKYVFIGFNVLNKCEIELFKALKKAGKALFYWDTDEFYMNMKEVEHEAATFMKQNVSEFKNELSREALNEFNTSPKHFTIISSSTNNAQAKYLSKYLQQSKEEQYKDSECAVVLCDESMLLPTLHAIPDSVQELNITMGLPLIQTPVYALIKDLVEMRLSVAMHGACSKTIPLRYVKDVLVNPYVQMTFGGTIELFDEIVENNSYFPEVERLIGKSDDCAMLFSFLKEKEALTDSLSLLNWLSAILKRVANNYRDLAPKEQKKRAKELASDAADDIYGALYLESLYRCYTMVNRLVSLVETGDLTVNLQTLCKLLQRMLSVASVPFSGEPVRGMQIMGFLETRNLDFKNVVMLSVNEGILPKGTSESSFIPYSLKKGFEMTTIDHKNSLYAYYFYRLLQRAEKATFMYSSATTGGAKGQMSRFLMQLMVESGSNVTLQQKDLRSDIQVAVESSFEIVKTEEMMEQLRLRFDMNRGGEGLVSPTMLNTYLTCPMRFYFSYIVGLKETEDIEDGIDQRMLGLIVHKTLENIYNKYKNVVVERSLIESWLANELGLEHEVDNAFQSEYFHHANPIYSGQQILLKITALTYVKNALTIDLDLAPFTIVGDEKREKFEFDVDGSKFQIGGYIDRFQLAEGIYQVVDYKTGAKPKGCDIFPDGFAQLFSAEADRKYLAYAMQVWLYSFILHKTTGNPVIPYLMFVRSKTGLINPSDTKDELRLTKENADKICGEIEENLRSLIREIFSTEQSFKKTENVGSCGYCPFVEICMGKRLG